MKAVGENKYCPRCKMWKHVSGYGKDTKRADGLRCYCRVCHREQMKSYESKFRRNRISHSKKYRRDHPERFAAYDARRTGLLKETKKEFNCTYVQAAKILKELRKEMKNGTFL